MRWRRSMRCAGSMDIYVFPAVYFHRCSQATVKPAVPDRPQYAHVVSTQKLQQLHRWCAEAAATPATPKLIALQRQLLSVLASHSEECPLGLSGGTAAVHGSGPAPAAAHAGCSNDSVLPSATTYGTGAAVHSTKSAVFCHFPP